MIQNKNFNNKRKKKIREGDKTNLIVVNPNAGFRILNSELRWIKSQGGIANLYVFWVKSIFAPFFSSENWVFIRYFRLPRESYLNPNAGFGNLNSE